MTRLHFLICCLLLLLAACSAGDNRGTIGQLRTQQIEITAEETTGGLEKAMASYQRFLEENRDSALAPEAIRRLADLKIEKEYGLIAEGQTDPSILPGLTAPEPEPHVDSSFQEPTLQSIRNTEETDAEFENRTSTALQVDPSTAALAGSELDIDDLERVGAREAIELYQKLLNEYPLYERNDQVLYQMSRAYEELGLIEEAMEVMNRLVAEFPQSHYLDEVQFRRAEYLFTHRDFLGAEEAYKSIVDIGVGSSYFQLALYKLGWTFYKQELYEEALDRFIALLDYKVSVGFDFEQVTSESERKRMDDTFRVISLGFSYLGGVDAVVDYFSRQEPRSYENHVYSNLGEYYFIKRRYSDAVSTYAAFASRNPFHKQSPQFQMRVIEINIAGGFPSLVIESKKAFATSYGLQAEYWQYFDPKERADVLGFLKTNLTDLANHYHALYQKPDLVKQKLINFSEALHWYREFMVSFPNDPESPVINYQLADLLLENKSFAEAALEYEKTAYDFAPHGKASKAGYAAVYTYRKYLGSLPQADREPVRHEVVRSSLKFVETFPEHKKAAIILGAAADDLYAMGDYPESLRAAQCLVENFSDTETEVLRQAWLVVAHSSYELLQFSAAEAAYVMVLKLLPEQDKTRAALVDNLAATIYKQGEEANADENYLVAAEHFLRISTMAPTSTIRPTAEYDAAAALIQLQSWERAISVLSAFRDSFPGHELQPEVTKKIAYVYREDGQHALAAEQYERIETESTDTEVRRDALLIAAQLYEDADSKERALTVYQRYVEYFPLPVELNLETRNKISEILKEQGDQDNYLKQLRQIVAIDASAGGARSERTQYLAAQAALVLAEVSYERFLLVRIVKPFKSNLRKKQTLMKSTSQEFSALLDYQVGEVTAAATFYLAEIYAHFSKALIESERPEGLSPLEMEEYELAIEEQAYPFEDKAITVHQSNLELISLGVYNRWIEKSLAMLAIAIPARYAKPEQASEIITSLDVFSYELVAPVTATGGTAVMVEPAADDPLNQQEPLDSLSQSVQVTETPAEQVAGSVETSGEQAPADSEQQELQLSSGDVAIEPSPVVEPVADETDSAALEPGTTVVPDPVEE